MSTKGLVLVNTGPGKGKTTAALGVAVRALGQGFKVAFLQFIKNQETGESRFLKEYAENHPGRLYYNRLGLGLILGQPSAGDRAQAEAALKAAGELLAGDYDLVVLDEICVAVSLGLIEAQAVAGLITSRPPRLNLILTGRGCPPEIIDLADTVTEMTLVKHAYQAGLPASRGIEF
ncbi:MAG: cob(I)yrinic acid a,c-diamide adenosyltransferase [Candidatus Adiutrix sp.]|jgi:cob(I)alamin adenosyltransferase|nr:cob(I)yrinic acid a,c-diamide adenosyltransferase [Candidatus Adiutrix sp.]